MKKKTLILLGAAILIAAGAGAGIYFFLPNVLPDFLRPAGAAPKKQTQKIEETRHEPEVGADLDVFVVNLAGQTPARYLRTALSLGVRSEKEKEQIKELAGPIRDAVIMYLTERKVEDLVDLQGKAKLRAELLKKINEVIGQKMVLNVYFKEFLIQ